MQIDINVRSSRSACNSNPCGPGKPEPAKPTDPCKKNECQDPCKSNKSMSIGFGVMPLGMIAFGGFGLGKFF